MQNEVISNARNKVMNLLDEKSFVEFDELSDASVVAGYGTILRRPVCIFAQDLSVSSGAITESNCNKICKTIDMAVKTGVPLIGIYDSMGAKITERTRVFCGLQKVFSKLANASGVIPQISIVNKMAIGINTLALSFSDFVFMLEDSKMFINSPQILTASMGKDIFAKDIGGSSIHFNKTGACQFVCDNDTSCAKMLRELLSHLPDNNMTDVELIETDDNNRLCDELNKDNINVEDIIKCISDNNTFLEVSAGFASNIIIGFSRIGSRSVGIVANNREYIDGRIDIDAIDKASRFVRFCDAFNIPIITLIDTDGFKVSMDEELNGLVRKSGKLLYAYADAFVTKINIIFGNAYGGANLMMGTCPDMVLAWNTSKVSVVEPKSAVNILFSEDIKNAELPVMFREEKLKEYMSKDVLPENAAKDNFIDAVISPSETRLRIISALDMFSGKRESKALKRHGNMPL